MKQQSPQGPIMPIITKSPGKILVAGGYGVLQDKNYGLSLGLQSYFYCVCTEYEAEAQTYVRIDSKQIRQYWQYIYDKNSATGLREKQGKLNGFVAAAVQTVLTYYHNIQKAGIIKIHILFNRNFISDEYIHPDYNKDSQFPTYREGYSKTGLGSSACVLVSIVKCLVNLFSKNPQQDNQTRLINVLSQYANLAAQKKIGSNFDISTAVFGSHLYRNVLPYRILQLLQVVKQKVGKQELQWEFWRDKINQLAQIDPQIQNIKILESSESYHGYIIDVNKGADTRAMVRSFTAQLKKLPKQLQSQFYSTSKQIALKLKQSICSKNSQQIKQTNKAHRELQQKYTDLTGVPIEPIDLRPMLNQLSGMEGIVYVICPGSGGYDAVFVLALRDAEKQIAAKIQAGSRVRPVGICWDGLCDLQHHEEYSVIQALGLIKN